MSNDDLVLLTGVTGFIGSHTTIQLLNEGYRVRGTLRSMSRADAIRSVIAQHAPVDHLEFFEAELTDAGVWDRAMEGVSYVQHIASPFPTVAPENEDDLIIPARDGALNVIAAAHRAGVKRVVMTSSAAAVAYGHADENRVFDETDWTDVSNREGTGPYIRSKTIAERAAWDFVEQQAPELELVTINPAYVLGPILEKDPGSSAQAIKKPLSGEMPGTPRLPINCTDVRDIATAHLLAMTTPGAAGQRFVTNAGFLWYSEVIDVLREHLPSHRKKLPKFVIPSFLVRLVALVDPEVRSILVDLDKDKRYDCSKARDVLRWQPRSPEESVRATAESLVAQGLV